MLARISLVRAMAALSLQSHVPALSLQSSVHFSTISSAESAAAEEENEKIALPTFDVSEMRTVRTMKKEIRVSPRKLGLLAAQIRGLPAPEALVQMQFSPKRKAAIVKKTIQNAINLADINYGIEPSKLKVAEAFVNKGLFLKRLKIMGRGIHVDRNYKRMRAKS